MENLEIHSKSYLVRWVHAAGNRTISWSLQPHKKSINLGLFRHPGGSIQAFDSATATGADLPTPPAQEENATGPSSRRVSSSTRSDTSAAAEKLQAMGLILIRWMGRSEADKISKGSFDVPGDQGGMYALVFDNTFSKQLSKTATLFLMIYHTATPPDTLHHANQVQPTPAAAMSSLSLGGLRPSPRMSPARGNSAESLHEDRGAQRGAVPEMLRHDSTAEALLEMNVPSIHTGVLQKRRRKRHQGYARRYFSLDFVSGTLSYYHDRQSSALRGAIPLSLAVMGANEKTREISVDSGAEVWHLRAASPKDFETWREALDRASRSAMRLPEPGSTTTRTTASAPNVRGHAAGDGLDWARVEALLGRIAGIRDAVRRLAAHTKLPAFGEPATNGGILEGSPAEIPATDYFQDRDRRRFWKRKVSGGIIGVGACLPTPPVKSRQQPVAAAKPSDAAEGSNGRRHPREIGVHGHCSALLGDLDSVVSDFSALMNRSKRSRLSQRMSSMSRYSVDSTSSTQEFFDAEDDLTAESQIVRIDDSDEEGPMEDCLTNNDDSASSSGTETPGTSDSGGAKASLYPHKPKSLSPLPLGPVARRSTIPPASVMPPSLVGFLRRNMGKDLSAISMPVSANEPLSLLQRLSEPLEYTSLLDRAARAELDSTRRLLYVAAFALSSLSSNRVKERAIRKPFNPMLGETFELVREDHGFRFLAEKVSHRPIRIACQAESAAWTYTQSATPTQKFYGKSAELTTDGTTRVILHATGDCFHWRLATCYLRNVLAGEKYVEPFGTMTVFHEPSGAKAVATFKAKGMFSGRSEDVVVHAYSSTGDLLPLGLAGKWPSMLALALTRPDGLIDSRPSHGPDPNAVADPDPDLDADADDIGTSIWQAGSLVAHAVTHYGFTAFAASLNETTSIERGKLPATDSRLRPDQRAAERGALDHAETLKAQLEEAQRARRKELERDDAVWEPRWFERVESNAGGGGGGEGGGAAGAKETGTGTLAAAATAESDWRLKSGRNGYWEQRERGSWSGVVDLFAVA
ncbi:MAG: hypothetical protein M1826_006402 [Phylliscum demangeonii]|nr:MAG: hypothetical protein M1826_006402 [Phylliscum demangeonii]